MKNKHDMKHEATENGNEAMKTEREKQTLQATYCGWLWPLSSPANGRRTTAANASVQA